jgi:LAO/AO transport system ATPase
MGTSTAAPGLAERVLSGDVRAVARAISVVEDESDASAHLISRLFPHTGQAYLIGVTGPPGAGKSTLVDRLTGQLREAGRTVGIVAVDPTSPFTGGAILGDRVRMQSHAADPGVFIRSMATRGNLGGLARATGDATIVLDASGRDIIIVETVGVGQDEVDIVRTADVSIVVLVPGTGDEVQALKAGIMEIADIFVVNKADREGEPRVECARRVAPADPQDRGNYGCRRAAAGGGHRALPTARTRAAWAAAARPERVSPARTARGPLHGTRGRRSRPCGVCRDGRPDHLAHAGSLLRRA